MTIYDYLESNENMKLTDEDITKVEEKYSFKFPKEMREFYLKQNGGYLHTKSDNMFCGYKDYQISTIYPIILDKDSHDYKFKNNTLTIDYILHWQLEDGLIPMNYIPFARNAGGDDYCFNSNEEDYGTIYVIYADSYDNFLENPKEFKVANSFAELIENINEL